MLKNWCLTFFAALSEARMKTKKMHRVLEFNQSQWLKPHVEFNTQKRIEVEEKGNKDRKTLW